jgi:peptidoglycan/LPS O-acetylase OafA/YrhL
MNELDAMRGIAALTVVLSHAARNLPDPNELLVRVLSITPIRPVIDGRPAVLFFFVLSGFVLSRALLVDQPPGYVIFALRRLLRLCLPAAAALLLSAALYVGCYPRQPWLDPAAWLSGAWTQVPSLRGVLRQALLIGSDGDFYLDPVLWSLVHELRFSLVLPLVIAAALRWDRRGGNLLLISGGLMFGLEVGGFASIGRRSSSMPFDMLLAGVGNIAFPALTVLWVAARGAWLRTATRYTGGTLLARLPLVACCVLAGALLGLQVGHGGEVMLGHSMTGSFMATLYFAPSFLAGVALALGRPEPSALRPEQRTRFIIGALLLLCYDNAFATVIASAMLLVWARQPGRLRTALRRAPWLFLGRISFSLYLVHLPLLLALSHGLHGVLTRGATNLLSLLLSVPAAWVLYRVAERPAQRLASRIGRLPQFAAA